MNPNQRRPIPCCDPYVIDRRGRVFNSKTRKEARPMPAALAARRWNDHAHAKNQRGSADVGGIAARLTASGRPVADAVGLLAGKRVAWYWLRMDLPAPNARPVAVGCPPEWIDLCGDPASGWVLLRVPEAFDTLFHAPSVAALLHNGDSLST